MTDGYFMAQGKAKPDEGKVADRNRWPGARV